MRAELIRREKAYIAQFERKLQQDASLVWSMLADNRNLARWFQELRIAEEGKGGKLIFNGQDGSTEELAITDYQEGKILAFEWWGDHICFKVEQEGEHGSRLNLVKTIKQLTSSSARDLAGWHICLDAIEALLNNEEINRAMEWQRWHSEYERLVDSMTVEFE